MMCKVRVILTVNYTLCAKYKNIGGLVRSVKEHKVSEIYVRTDMI